MTDKYIDVILDAIKDLKNDKDIEVETDDLSTMLKGSSVNVFQALETVFLRASKQTDHVVMNITFSHGCPGEPNELCCNTCNCDEEKMETKTMSVKKSGLAVSAQFALYPMNNPEYMDIIYNEIKQAKNIVTVTPKHFCTRLDGDAHDIFRAIEQSLINTVEKTKHVVITAIISKKNNVK